MSLLEIVERLCNLTRIQAEIIKKQAVELEQAKIADQVAAEFAEMRKTAETELEEIYKDFY